MKDPLLRTKLQRPPIAPDIVPRDRLLELLNSGRQRPLTLISAPAGYGKSTLASRWVAGCTCPSGWVSLDENDNDLRSFLGYVLAAVRSGFPRMVLQSEAFIEAGQLPSPQALARYLLNDLHQVREPFILVLDDFHCIHDDTIKDLIAELLVHPSTRMHLVLLVRRDPALPLASLRGRGQLTEIRAADLRFTPEETAAFVGRMLNVEVDSTTAALLEMKTEGWVTGLRLAGLYLRDQENLAQRVAELSGNSRNIASRNIAEYLVTEVLSRQPPEMAVLLMESAILDRFCAPLLAALRGARADQETLDTKAFIRWLVDANIFLVPLDDEGYWYRYHHLFQEFLLSLLHERRDPDTITQLHKKTSRWFAENELPDEAIRHALLAGDTQTAVRLAIAHRYELMNNSQFFHLKRWLEALRMDVVAETPLLVSAPAFIGIEHGQDVDVYTYTEAAKRILGSLSPGSAEYAALNGEVKVIQGFIDMVWGNADSALAHTEEALESLSSRAYLIRSLGVLTLAACHQMKGEIEHAVQEIRKTISNPGWPANIRARIHFYLAIISYMEADLDGAIAASRECLRLVRGYPFTHTTTFAWYLIGAAHYWRNETAEAESHLLKVLADYHLSNPSYTGNAGFVMACICLARNCAQKADQVLKQVSNHFREYNYATMGWSLRCGRGTSARHDR